MKKDIIEKVKNNKPLKVIWNIFYAILVIFVLLLLLIVIMQRVSNNKVTLGGFSIFNIVTASMEPKYMIGDVLLAKNVSPQEIEIGDDVVYKGEKGNFAGKIVTHQVIDIEEENNERKFHTKGLANDEEDPVISSSQVYGEVIYKIKTLSIISKIVNNLYAFYFAIFVPIAIILFIEIRKTVISIREEKDKNKKIEESDKNNKE